MLAPEDWFALPVSPGIDGTEPELLDGWAETVAETFVLAVTEADEADEADEDEDPWADLAAAAGDPEDAPPA